MLPISALNASVFIARLIFRIGEFLPIARMVTDGPVDWRGFLAGLLRMSHVTDILFELRSLDPLAEDVWDEIQFLANTSINSRNPKWPDEVAARMTARLPKRLLRSVSRGNNPLSGLTDAMKYVQVGRPETIVITQNRPNTNDLSRLEEAKGS